MRRRIALAVAAILLIPSIGIGTQPLQPDASPLSALLDRTIRYVADFERIFSSMVAEERLVQEVMRRLGPRRQVRVTRADYLLVQRPNAAGWMPFRDVFEVDGQPVRDRENRLHRLFLEPGSNRDEEARRITEESARFNIGPIARTMNVPTLPLLFLSVAYRDGFDFTDAGAERIGDIAARKVRYKERGRPTVVRNRKGESVPAAGIFWIEPSTGAIIRTYLELLPDGVRARVTVDYTCGRDPEGLWVPATMREQYDRNGPGTIISTSAAYSNLRRFQVTTSEEIKTLK